MPRRENLLPSLLLRIQSRYGVTFVPSWVMPRRENLLPSLLLRIQSKYGVTFARTNLSKSRTRQTENLLPSLLLRIQSSYGVTFVPTWAMPRTNICYLLPSLLVINTVLTIVPTWAIKRTEIYLLLSWSECSPAMASPLYQPEQCHEQRSAFFSHGQKPVQTWCQLCNYWSAFHPENLGFHKREHLQFEQNVIFFRFRVRVAPTARLTYPNRLCDYRRLKYAKIANVRYRYLYRSSGYHTLDFIYHGLYIYCLSSESATSGRVPGYR